MKLMPAMRPNLCRILLSALVLAVTGACAGADTPAFDLLGPKVDVHVQRAGRTLPIANVPNLQAGDRLWIHPDLPETQAAHYVLVVAFLRGSTNPPPLDWFKRVETWAPAVRQEGVFVVVPAEAEQALLFLAPETGGDFSTLRKAVQGRPGAFVRATQDLQQASWDRLRLDAYLSEVKKLPLDDPKVLKERTELAARSLGIRVDQQCFDKPTEQQAPCLIQHTEGLVLDDSNAQSVVMQMANGSAGDMMNQLSYSTAFGAGAFSPYVGAIVDLARILSTIHTARYQYIPALALPQREQPDTLNLRLNVPPSFRDPKSVIVVALPPVGPVRFPQMHAAEGTIAAGSPDKGSGGEKVAAAAGSGPPESYCATKPELALGADGGPLVFATAMAHELTLHVDTKAVPGTGDSGAGPGHAELAAGVGLGSGAGPTTIAESAAKGIDVPVRPDPTQGGFVLAKPLPLLPETETTAELRGEWGFDTWVGPRFHLNSPHAGGWTVQASDQNALITGREDVLHLEGPSALCVSSVTAELGGHDMEKHDLEKKGQEKHPQEGHGQDEKLTWRSPKPEILEVSVPLRDVGPGTVTIAVHQYGLDKPDRLPLQAYAEAASLEHLSLSSGDKAAVLKGTRLDEVESAELAGISFTPAALNRVKDLDQLEMAASGLTATLEPGDHYQAKVLLRDGRTVRVGATVTPARPQLELLSKGVQREDAAESGAAQQPAQLGGTANNSDDLPLQRKLVFFLRSRVPGVFPRTEKVEVAATDGSFGATLSLADRGADGGMMLEDAHTAVLTLDALARFGASAFGPIQLRAVSADGVSGDWISLGTLVRLPAFAAGGALRCPRNMAKPCQLTGNNLFLLTAVGSSADMANAVDVPAEYTGTTLQVPNVVRTLAANAGGAPGSQAGVTGTLYVRLRDDPGAVQMLSMPVVQTGSAPEPVKASPPAEGAVSGTGPAPASGAAQPAGQASVTGAASSVPLTVSPHR